MSGTGADIRKDPREACDVNAEANAGGIADAAALRLHDYELSGNGYKVRLLLSMLGLEAERIDVDFYPGAEHRQDAFLALNPLGQLPVLEHGDLVLRDSKAILVYLAGRYDAGGAWWPVQDAVRTALTVQWLAFADELTASAGQARLVEGFFHDGDVIALRARAHDRLRILERHLWFAERAGRSWLVPGDRPTLADIACFAHVALSEEGGVMREDYPATRRWCDRVGRLPGFVPMPGVFPPGPGPAECVESVEPDGS